MEPCDFGWQGGHACRRCDRCCARANAAADPATGDATADDEFFFTPSWVASARARLRHLRAAGASAAAAGTSAAFAPAAGAAGGAGIRAGDGGGGSTAYWVQELLGALPEGHDPSTKEAYLSDVDFTKVSSPDITGNAPALLGQSRSHGPCALLGESASERALPSQLPAISYLPSATCHQLPDISYLPSATARLLGRSSACRERSLPHSSHGSRSSSNVLQASSSELSTCSSPLAPLHLLLSTCSSPLASVSITSVSFAMAKIWAQSAGGRAVGRSGVFVLYCCCAVACPPG